MKRVFLMAFGVAAALAFAGCAAPAPQPSATSSQPAMTSVVKHTPKPAPSTSTPAPLTYAAPCLPQAATKPIPAGKKRLVIATSGEGGVFYPAGNALAAALGKSLANTEIITKSTDGSQENLRMLAKGEADLAFASLDVAYDALKGAGPFAGNGKSNVCALAFLYSNYLHILALQNSGIDRIEDLRGKTISVGSPASPAEIAASRVLTAAGLELGRDSVGANITPKRDVTATYMTLEQSVSALKNGEIAALFWMGDQSLPPIYQLMQTGQAKYISVDDLYGNLGSKIWPVYVEMTLPQGVYPNMAEAARGIGIGNAVLANANMNMQTARDILQAMFANADLIRASRPELAKFAPESAKMVSRIPFHAGAVDFFKAMK